MPRGYDPLEGSEPAVIGRRIRREFVHPLLDQFEACVGKRGDYPAASDQALTLSYQALSAVVGGLAGQIRSATQKKTVGLLVPTSVAGAAAIFASWYADKTPVPLNFMLAPEELGKIIRDAEFDTILTVDFFAAAAGKTGLKTILLNAQTLVPGRAEKPAAEAGDTAVLLYTSGTSGDPKGVELTFGNLVNNANSCIEHARISPEQNFLSVLPQFHSFGFTAMTVVPLVLGATVHFQPRFSPVTILNTIVEKQISVFMAIASMWTALGHSKHATAEMFRSVKIGISGGEPLQPRVFELYKERFGLTILEGYGLTETSPVVSINTPEHNRPRSVGRPIPGVTITIEDETGARLPTGKDGEIVIRGHCVMKGYHHKPKETAAVLRDGALHTGDMGRVDEDGFVYITGRIKEMMIVGGENVFPIEIESVLAEHAAVAEAAAIGVADDLRGEVPVAFVILKEGATASEVELRDFCRGKLAGYKVPRQVLIKTELPRGGTGKILKRALKPLLPA